MVGLPKIFIKRKMGFKNLKKAFLSKKEQIVLPAPACGLYLKKLSNIYPYFKRLNEMQL